MFITFSGKIRGYYVRGLHDHVRNLHGRARGLHDHVHSHRDHVRDLHDHVHIRDFGNLKCSNWSIIYL